MNVETSGTDGATLFTDLMAISRAAHLAGQHEVAYHALTAAMHAGEDARDRSALAEVVREAEAQIARIDQHTPQHRLSTASAARHQHPGVYAMLVRQTNVHLEMLRPRAAQGLAEAATRVMRDAPARDES